MRTSKNAKSIVYGIVAAFVLTVTPAQGWAADGVISRTPLGDENYCHLKFPAIVPSTLGSDHPQLKDADSGDIIDYYGPCDHDPLGKDEVQTQEHDQQVRRRRNADD